MTPTTILSDNQSGQCGDRENHGTSSPSNGCRVVVSRPTETNVITCQEKSLHIAPMLDVTGREFRQLMRILSQRCVLWTEMVVDTTILHTTELDFHLSYEENNSHPIICQIGGSDADQLRTAARTILEYGYDEINLNMDCPSNRVAGKRQFGAVLMKQPEIAANAVRALCDAVEAHNEKTSTTTAATTTTEQAHSRTYGRMERPVDVSVKTRIGVDDTTSLEDSIKLIRKLNDAGCTVFHIHARSAILGGKLNPAQNRSIPPLHYKHVYDLCRTFPHCKFYLNGGIKTLVAAREICFGRNVETSIEQNHGTIPCKKCGFPNGSCIAPPYSAENVPPNLCGVLLGRAALDNPCMLWDVDRYFYGEPSNPCSTRRQVLDQYIAYLRKSYPRRCCDRDATKTTKRMETPNYVFEYDYCSECADVWCEENDHRDKEATVAPPGFSSGALGESAVTKTGKGKKQDTTKISSHVMYVAIKPVQNIFFGLPKSQLFRRECDALVHNLEVRNCGPAALIKRALKVVPNELLDQPFVPADESCETNENVARDARLGLSRNQSSIESKSSNSVASSGFDIVSDEKASSPKQQAQTRRPRSECRHKLPLLFIIGLMAVLQRTAAGLQRGPLLGRQRNTSIGKQKSALSSSSSFFSDNEPPYLAIITEPDACSSDERMKATLSSIETAVGTQRVDLVSVRLQGNAATATNEELERACRLTKKLVELSEGQSIGNDYEPESQTHSKPTFFVVCSSDWVEVAVQSRAHGVHVKEMHLENIPRLIELFDYDILIGTSTHSVESALASSSRYNPHYYFVGTCFVTESHPEKSESELEGPSLPGKVNMALQKETKSCDNTKKTVPPIFAIGGIDDSNCMVPIQSGADGVAVIRAVLQASKPGEVVAHMHESMKRAIMTESSKNEL